MKKQLKNSDLLFIFDTILESIAYTANILESSGEDTGEKSILENLRKAQKLIYRQLIQL